jgi:hypothetical protein
MLHIRAQFTGQDSLGYEHGQTYELFIEALSILAGHGSTIRIMRPDQQGICPYRTIETFLANWTRIEVQERE